MRKLVINASTKFATGVLSKEQKPLVIGKQVEMAGDGKKAARFGQICLPVVPHKAVAEVSKIGNL
jgi:hypothetical protein